MTLLPQPRLLAALVGGSVLFLLLLLSPVFIIVPLLYYAAMGVLILADARRLPPKSGFMASRVLPQPFSLGEVQAVQVLVAHGNAAGLPAELADHVPPDLGPDRRLLAGQFDGEGLLAVEYSVQPPHRGAYRFGPVDLRCWRPGGWLTRQVRIKADEAAAVYPDVLAIKRYELMLRRGMRIMAGLRRARPPGATTAFAGLRDYLPGDEIRRISWKATARRDRPRVMEVEAARELVAHAIRLSHRHLVMVVAMADPEVLAARSAPIDRVSRAYEWAAAEELLSARRASFEQLRQGGVLGLDVEAGQLSPSLVERYLELKERALL